MADDTSRVLTGMSDTMYRLENAATNVISDIDSLPRGDMGGYNIKKLGKVNVLYPRLSRADYDVLQYSSLPEETGQMDMLMGGMSRLPKMIADSVRSSRKVVRRDNDDGTVSLFVVPSVGKPMSEAEVADLEQGADPSCVFSVPSDEQLAKRGKARVYRLAQLFTDSDATDKYEFPPRLVETARRVAVVNPPMAAKYLQDYMNSAQDVVRVRVQAEPAFKSRSLAQSTLRTVGGQYKRTDVMVRSDVAMDTFIMHGPDGDDQWYVSGPLKYATEVSYVYWMMFHAGRIFPNILFALELVLLGIDVCIEGSVAEPVVEFHVADSSAPRPRSGLSPASTSAMTAEQRVQVASFSGMMRPVMSSSGEQLATAVQVTGRHAVVNAHVMMADPNCTVDGQQLVVKRQLSRDVVCVTSERDAEPWTLREPRVHEWVIICYMVDDEVSCSQPVQIASLADESLVLTMDRGIGPGVSGGSVVALEDMALLGIHSGATRANLLAFRFGDAQFSELLDADSISAVSRPGDVGEFAERAIGHLRERGLSPVFKTAVSCLEAVFSSGEHVGTAIHVGGYLYTTCNPDMHVRVGAARKPMVWDKVSSGLYKTRDESCVISPVYRRAPNYFEKVFVIGFDGEPYLSAETEVAHMGLGAKTFIIRDISGLDRPLMGGLIMGYDGAFLGICGARNFNTAVGLGYVCVTVPVHQQQPIGPQEVLTRVFPFLNVHAWSTDLVEEVFTHASVGAYRSGKQFNAGCKPLANIGDSVLKTVLFEELRDKVYPHSQWQSGRVQALQSNAVLSEVAWTKGFAKCIVVGPGTTLTRNSKAYADLTEALVGAASLVEGPDVVRQLVASLGATGAPVASGTESVADITGLGVLFDSPKSIPTEGSEA